MWPALKIASLSVCFVDLDWDWQWHLPAKCMRLDRSVYACLCQGTALAWCITMPHPVFGTLSKAGYLLVLGTQLMMLWFYDKIEFEMRIMIITCSRTEENQHQNYLWSQNDFYVRQHICHSAYIPRQFRLSVCPSVCPSHACTVFKWLNISSKFFHSLIGPSLYRPKAIHCNYHVGHYSGFSRISPSILNRFTPNLQA